MGPAQRAARVGLAQVCHEEKPAVRFVENRGIRAALLEFPDAGEEVGVDGALGDEAFRAKARFVEPAQSAAGAEHTADGRARRDQGARPGDDRMRLLLDVAKVWELLGQSTKRAALASASKSTAPDAVKGVERIGKGPRILGPAASLPAGGSAAWLRRPRNIPAMVAAAPAIAPLSMPRLVICVAVDTIYSRW